MSQEIRKSPIKMFHDRVIAESVSPESLIHIPDTAKRIDTGKKLVVVDVGPGRINEAGVEVKPPCKVGDNITIIPGSGILIPIGNRTFVALDSSHVIGIIDHEFVAELVAEKERKDLEARISG